MLRSGMALAVGFALATAAPAAAAPLTLSYDSRNETKTLLLPAPAAAIRLDGRLPGPGAIMNSLTFMAPATTLALSAGWLVQPPENRTVGVNIDLLDFNGMLVASDSFQGVTAGLATSSLVASGLVTGANYTMLFTGTAVGNGRYLVDIAGGPVPTPITALPVAQPVPDHLTFDSAFGTKTWAEGLAAGDTLQVDGIVQGGPASLRNTVTSVVTSGVLSAAIEWLTQGPLRTTGVNIDVLNAFDEVVASDVFQGVTAGRARSTLSVSGLPIGTYRLLFTGNASTGARYHIDLSATSMIPDFTPIPVAPGVAVPAPPALALFLGFMLAFGALRRPA